MSFVVLAVVVVVGGGVGLYVRHRAKVKAQGATPAVPPTQKPPAA